MKKQSVIETPESPYKHSGPIGNSSDRFKRDGTVSCEFPDGRHLRGWQIQAQQEKTKEYPLADKEFLTGFGTVSTLP